MKHYRLHQIDSAGLTESLCDGLTKRIFQELEGLTQNFMESMGVTFLFSTVDDFLNAEISYIHCDRDGEDRLTKRQALARLVGLFAGATYVDLAAFGLTPLPKKAKEYPSLLPGLTVHNGRLQTKVLSLKRNKPVRSEVLTNPILYSKHAVSRLIFRFKPMFLSLDLMHLNDCINILLVNACDPEKTEYWLPIANIGSFLLRRDEVQPELIHVVTFVDHNKLTLEQVNDGLHVLNILENTNRQEKANFDSHVSNMLQFRAKTTVNLPKVIKP